MVQGGSYGKGNGLFLKLNIWKKKIITRIHSFSKLLFPPYLAVRSLINADGTYSGSFSVEIEPTTQVLKFLN